MSTILRTLRNLRKIGIKEYLHQMQYIGDTKAGTYIATDKAGNKYYENLEQELPRHSYPSIWRHVRTGLTLASSTDKMGRLQAKGIQSVG